MFVVLATHNTGHGEATNIVQLTEDIHEAIRTEGMLQYKIRYVDKIALDF